MGDSTRPRWPFPEHGKLTAHPKGKWCKWMKGEDGKGRTEYFGHWRNPDPDNEWATAALNRYLEFVRGRQRGQEAPTAPSDLTLELAVNHYLSVRTTDLQEGKLCLRQFVAYKGVTKTMLAALGREVRVADLQPGDFEVLRRAVSKGKQGPLGPVSVGNRVQWVRTIFEWVDEFYGVRPRYGGQFDKPERREMRHARRGRVLFTPVEIRKMLRVAGPAMRCFILLGINCGFGQIDCATVPRAAFDLRKGMMRWKRGKTGVDRACPLWPETVAALKKYQRPHTAEPSLMFITEKLGNRWVRDIPEHDATGKVVGAMRKDSLGQAFRVVEKAAKVKPVRGFYTLRHTFRTMAEGTGDVNAVRAIMGQSFSGMDDFYLHLSQRPDYLRRLRKVTDVVRRWVFQVDSKSRPARRDRR